MTGGSILGHCYLKRSERWDFAFGLTHEACHAGGFFRFEIRNQPTIHRIACRGMGLGRRYSDSQPFEYLGLMEAATETAAENVRVVLSKVTKTLTAEEIDMIGRTVSYVKVITAVNFLIERILKGGPSPMTDRKTMLTDLITDHFTGRGRFLRAVRRWNPKAVEILRQMDDTDAGAEEVRLLAALR